MTEYKKHFLLIADRPETVYIVWSDNEDNARKWVETNLGGKIAKWQLFTKPPKEVSDAIIKGKVRVEDMNYHETYARNKISE